MIHRFRSKNNESKTKTKFYNHDADTSQMSATYEDLKKYGVNHELNLIRRISIQQKLNKYQHPSSNHRLLKGYRDTGEWLNWIGIVADISMPTTSSLDGKILIDKFCYENSLHQVKLLDYHVWLKTNEIRYLLNADKQTIGVGDTIRGISKVTKYSSKGLSNKYGLGATLLKGAGIYVSIPTKKTLAQSTANQLVTDYDRQDDWVVKLSNAGVPKQTLRDYHREKDINVFIAKNRGHVSARFQPSRYNHYFERLEAMPQKILQHEKEQHSLASQYYGIVDNFKVYQKKDSCHSVIHFSYIVDDIKRIITGSKWFEYDGEILKLGSLRPKDVIGFKDNRDLIKSSGTLEPLTNVELLTKHQSDPMPDNQSLVAGWVIKNFGKQKNVLNQNDLVNKYERWLKTKRGEDIRTPFNIGFSIDEIAEKTTVTAHQIQKFLDQHSVQPIFSEGNKDYYAKQDMDLTVKHFKQVHNKAKAALQVVRKTKDNYLIDKNKKQEEVKKMTNKDNSVMNTDTSKAKTTKAPNNDHVIKIITSRGRFTTLQFKTLQEAYIVLQQALQSGYLNYFIKAKDEAGSDCLISVKNIISMS